MHMQTFYPSYFKAYFCLLGGLLLIGIELTLVWAGLLPKTLANPVGGDQGPAIIIGMIIVPPAMLLLDIAIGIFRSKAIVTDAGLDLTTTRFAIWKIRRVHRVKLAWSEVFGIQLWEQTNSMAADGIQRDCIVHTAAGKYALSNMVWPNTAEFAEAVSQHLGRAAGDIQEGATLVKANRARDKFGLAIMHGLGSICVLCGSVLLLLTIFSLTGGASLEDAGIIATLCSTIIAGGVALRRYHMD
jgi:hypothetical protein